jgi:hypothetical protein
LEERLGREKKEKEEKIDLKVSTKFQIDPSMDC